MISTRSTLVLLLLAAATRGAAQEAATLVPGSALLHPERIQASTDTFTINNYRDGVLWLSATLVRNVTRVQEDDRTLLRLSQTYDTPEGVTVDTTWLDASTLAPVGYFADVYGEIQEFTFSAREARGTVTPRDSASRNVVHNATSQFFNAVALDLLFPALDLTEHFNVTLEAYNPPRGALALPIRYVSREKVLLDGGSTVDAIKIAFGPTGTHLWLDAQGGALLIQGGGRGGGHAFWKVRTGVDASALIAESLK